MRANSAELPGKVNADEYCENAKRNVDTQNARIEHDKALGGAICGQAMLSKRFTDNPTLDKSLPDATFSLTYQYDA